MTNRWDAPGVLRDTLQESDCERFPSNVSEAHTTIPMPEPNSSSPLIPEQTALEIRRIAHELSNSLEVIVQTSYLLSMAELKGPAAEWLRMLDSGVNKALEQNLALREFIKRNSPQ